METKYSLEIYTCPAVRSVEIASRRALCQSKGSIGVTAATWDADEVNLDGDSE